MRLDDKRIHFPIHQRNAAISIEMTELASMKGNLLQIVTNVNLSFVMPRVYASFQSSLHPPSGPQSPITQPGKMSFNG